MPGSAKTFQQPQTSEALDLYGADPAPSADRRAPDAPGTPEWRNLIDATVVPYLADHRIDGEIVVPGSAFAEMALAVAREIFPDGPIGLEDFDLLQWLPLQPDARCANCRCAAWRQPCRGDLEPPALWAPTNGRCMRAAALCRSPRRRRRLHAEASAAAPYERGRGL
jgi:hypothetical protein